jgi:hypothetical protein
MVVVLNLFLSVTKNIVILVNMHINKDNKEPKKYARMELVEMK